MNSDIFEPTASFRSTPNTSQNLLFVLRILPIFSFSFTWVLVSISPDTKTIIELKLCIESTFSSIF